MDEHVKLSHNGKDKNPDEVREEWITIAAPSAELVAAGSEALTGYLTTVRAEVQSLLWQNFRGASTVRYELMADGKALRGGYFTSPWIALQELLHETSAAASQHVPMLRRFSPRPW